MANDSNTLQPLFFCTLRQKMCAIIWQRQTKKTHETRHLNLISNPATLRAAAIPYQSTDWTENPDETTTFAHREDNFGEEQSCSCAEFYQDLRGSGGIVPIILTATGYGLWV